MIAWNDYSLKNIWALGFSMGFIRLIMFCINFVISLQILLKGGPTKSFRLRRRIQQGYPLSLYIFILCSKVLSRLIYYKESIREIIGVKADMRNIMECLDNSLQAGLS
ncbi:hypothetical protein G4B88_007592 [Cannabis sativa]|uniref:Uncharacterized protein n=1 Tax=Cannabis sativa TaxID=3483 RepID=A0A7J6HSN7_CANSA|nr:hypothetical protein G4B88_007592 [Cannabis sativa]